MKGTLLYQVVLFVIQGIQEPPDIENFEVDPSSDQYVGSENIDNDEESSMLHIYTHT